MRQKKKGICINTDVMEKIFDLPVIPMKARKGIGINELKEAVYISDKREAYTCPITPEEVYTQSVKDCRDFRDNIDRKIDNVVMSRKIWHTNYAFAYGFVAMDNRCRSKLSFSCSC